MVKSNDLRSFDESFDVEKHFRVTGERGIYTGMVDRIRIWKRLEGIGVVLHASGTAETSCLEQDSQGR